MSHESERTGEQGVGFLQYRIPKLGYIFRQAEDPDYGIDGEIEVTDDSGAATGRLVGVQVKAGADYFKEETETGFIFRESRRHLDYWQQHSLPVIIVLVDPDADVAYWVEVDSSAVTTGKQWKIEVPKQQILDGSAKALLREVANRMAEEVSARAQREYETIRELYLEGQRRSALSEITSLVAQTSWRFAPRSLQAEALRTLALWIFVLELDTSEAERYLLQARTADPSSDETVVRAMMKVLLDSPEAALPLLKNPKTAGAMNLYALLLIVTGDLDDGAAVLAAWPADIQRSAETIRVEALMAFASGDLVRARERIGAALAEKPRWFAVRETYALIEYALALPPSERPDITQPAPLPVPPALFRQDDESLQHLRAAAETFQALAKTVDDKDDRQRLELWHLAAVASDPERRADARLVASQLLDRPLWGPMLAWMLQRNLTDASDELIDRLLGDVVRMDEEQARADPGLIFLAAQVQFGRDQASHAAAILDQFEKPLLEKNADALHYWRARIAIDAGDTETAASEAALIGNAEMRTEATRQADEAEWLAVAEERLEAYAVTGDAAALFDAVRLHANHEQWEAVLARADELFRLLPNLPVLEMICDAAWRTGRYRLCLQWIEGWRKISTSRPEGLEQSRLACLIRIDPVAAVPVADDLLQTYPSSANVLRAMTAYLRIGDLKRVSIEARRLLKDPSIDSATLFDATQMTALEDPGLAIALFKRALELGVDDDQVGTAVSLAHQLDEDHATAELMPRMQKLAAEGRGGIRMMSLPEVLEFATSQQQRVGEILARYHAAEMPIHGVAQTLGWTLAEVFRIWTTENRAKDVAIAHRPLLTRFGGLVPPHSERVHGRQLAMDVTAFLLAADLDLLDTIEEMYAPIRVSRYLPAAIFEQQRRLADTQPSRVTMFGRIVRLVDEGQVRVLDEPGTPDTSSTGDQNLDVFARHAAADAVFVDQLPITDHDLKPIDLSPDLALRVVSLSDLIAAARRDAVIDEAAHRDVVIGLPPPTANPRSIPSHIVLSDLAVTTLADSDALEQIAKAAEVHLLASAVSEARATLHWSSRRTEISTWLNLLRERLRSGLEVGRYIADGETDVETESARDLDLESLLDLLRDGDATRAIWVEDRACSRLVGSTVSIGDILADLLERDSITPERHAALTHTLRASDLRYIPLNRKDLTVFVAAARSRELPDTKELQTVSRYMARIALDGNRSNGQASTPPELTVLLESANVSVSALPEIWKEHLNDCERAISHSAWFMKKVYAGRLAVRAAAEGKTSETTARHDVAADLAQLYMGALLVALQELPQKWEGSTTDQYVDWVSSSFALRKFFTDPELVDITGKRLAALARHFTEQFEAREELHDCTILIRGVFLLLPDELGRAWLRADPAFGERYGFRLSESVQIQGQSLPADTFWMSLERTIAGDEQTKDEPMRVSVSDERITVRFEGKTLHIDDPLFSAFAREGSDGCVEWSASHGEILDMPPEKRVQEAERIGGYATARERITAADELRAHGARVFYDNLREQLRIGETIPEAGFILSIESLTDQLRWIPTQGADAATLISDVGVEEALRRLVTLPTPLPSTVISELTETTDRVDIIRRLSGSVVAPLSMIHVVGLALRFVDDDESLRELCSELIDRLLSTDYEEAAYKAFESAYSAASAWLSFDAAGNSIPPDDRLLLAFSHASRLIDTIGQSDVRRAAEFFGAVTSLSREALSRDPEFFDHFLFPTNIDYLRVVVLGLAATMLDVPASARHTVEISERLTTILTRLKEENKIGGLLQDMSMCQRGIPLLFDVEPNDVITEIAGKPPYDIPTSAQLSELLTQVLEQAGEHPQKVDWWRAFQAIVQQHPLRTADFDALRTVVKNLADEVTRSGLDDLDVVMCLSSIARPVAAGGDESLREDLKSAYMGVAGEFSTGSRDAGLLSRVEPAFLEISLATAARPKQPMASAQELANRIDELIRVWPALAHTLASRLSELAWTVPVDQSIPLWRVVLRAREDVA